VLVSCGRGGDLTVTLIVFFGPGRQAIQRVMQCYVERNLVVNGGIVSDVIWQAHDSLGASDLAFLQVQTLPSMPCAKLTPQRCLDAAVMTGVTGSIRQCTASERSADCGA